MVTRSMVGITRDMWYFFFDAVNSWKCYNLFEVLPEIVYPGKITSKRGITLAPIFIWIRFSHFALLQLIFDLDDDLELPHQYQKKILLPTLIYTYAHKFDIKIDLLTLNHHNITRKSFQHQNPATIGIILAHSYIWCKIAYKKLCSANGVLAILDSCKLGILQLIAY